MVEGELAPFDIILLSSSLQYFENPSRLLKHLFTLLLPDGEIHIMDTPIYEEGSTRLALQRSKDYFSELGFPEMINYYHHHSWQNLADFELKILYRSVGLKNWNRIFHRSPFPWIRITRREPFG